MTVRLPVRTMALTVVVAAVSSSMAIGAERDLHLLWEDRCSECHGHSGEFARTFLEVSDGKLIGRHHQQNLRTFLGNHYLPARYLDDVYAMLAAQVESQARFRAECGDCHGSAAEFTRQSVEYREGALHGRRTRQPIADYLRKHRELSAADARYFSDTLTRLSREVVLHNPR